MVVQAEIGLLEKVVLFLLFVKVKTHTKQQNIYKDSGADIIQVEYPRTVNIEKDNYKDYNANNKSYMYI